MTDVQGNFLFTNVVPGTYTLHADYIGYTDINRPCR